MGRLKRMAAALGVVAVMAGTLFLLVRLLRPAYVDLNAYSDDASGLAEGSVVRLNGIPVGELDKIQLTTERDPKRKVVFRIKVKARYMPEIPEDSLVGVAATNLLGNEFLNIIRGHSSRPVQPGGELQALEGLDPQRLLAEMSNEFQQIQDIVRRGNALLSDVSGGRGNIGLWSKNGMKSFTALSAEVDRLMASAQNGRGTLAKLSGLSGHLQATQANLNDVTTALQSGPGTFAHLPDFMRELDEMTGELKQVTADLSSEKGPSARLTQLQQRFDELTARIQSSMDRINAGQGTLGRLTVNTQFSAALSNTGAEFQSLARDIRANPRKFLRLRVQLF